MRKVFITTNACTVVRHDTYVYSKYFELNGWDEVDSPEEADIVLVTCCAVTKKREDQAIKLIENLKGQINKDGKLIVAGCLPKINKKRLKETYDGVSFTSLESDILDKIITAKISIKDVHYDGCIKKLYHKDHGLDNDNVKNKLKLVQTLADIRNDRYYIDIFKQLTGGQHHYGEQDDSYLVKIAEGCNFNCSFCATKFVKGKLVSRNMERIIREFKEGVDKGYKKIMLMGDELGDYGRDIGSSLSELIDKLIEISDDAKIGIRYLEPNALVREIPRIYNHIESGKIYFLCTSIQSGSPKVLKLMNRNPELQPVINTIKKIRELDPDILLFTQMIVGFPQETEEDFQMTLDLINECRFDYVTTSLYSNRPNTKSSELDGQIEQQVIEDRYSKISNLSNLISNESFLNRIAREIAKDTNNDKVIK